MATFTNSFRQNFANRLAAELIPAAVVIVDEDAQPVPAVQASLPGFVYDIQFRFGRNGKPAARMRITPTETQEDGSGGSSFATWGVGGDGVDRDMSAEERTLLANQLLLWCLSMIAPEHRV